MPENIEENRAEEPTPGDITVGELLKLEKGTEAGDTDAQKRLAEIQGVDNYEQYLSLPKHIIEIHADDPATAGILAALKEVYDTGTGELSGLVAKVGENAITPEVWESLSNMQASVAALSSSRMDELSKQTGEALRLASMPWADGLRMQAEDALQLGGIGSAEYMQELFGLTAGKDAAGLGPERLAELSELAAPPLDQIQNALADTLMSTQPMSALARSLDESLERIKPSLAGLIDSTILGKDLLGHVEAPDLWLEAPLHRYAYVSSQERLADEVAESNRLSRELLAEMREERTLKRLLAEETTKPAQESPSSKRVQAATAKPGSSGHPRRMHLDTEVSLQHLRQIRAEAIANNRPIPKRSAAMSEAGIASRTWKTHDLELWARWEDKSFVEGKQGK